MDGFRARQASQPYQEMLVGIDIFIILEIAYSYVYRFNATNFL